MATRHRPYPGAGAYENFRQKVVQRFINFDRDAGKHVVGRNQSVAQVLGSMSLLYNAGLIPCGSSIIPSGARWQSLGGSRVEATEGAHCLPCQLLVIPPGGSRGIDPSDLLGLDQAVRDGIRTEFGRVTYLPALFNSADVVAEQCRAAGLRAAFAGACQEVVRGTRRASERRLVPRLAGTMPQDPLRGAFRDLWLIDRDAVRTAYRGTRVPDAGMAYELAMDEVQANRLAQYLAPLGRSVEPDLILEVLSAYRKHHRAQEPTNLHDRQMDETERVFNGH